MPFRESDLWLGYPDPTHVLYGVGKKALLVMVDAYRRQYDLSSIALLSVNRYGPGDNFDSLTSNVIPVLSREYEETYLRGIDWIVCQGSDSVLREFRYVEDASDEIVRGVERIISPMPINLGTRNEIRITHTSPTDREVMWVPEPNRLGLNFSAG